MPIAGTLLGATLDALDLDSVPGMLLFFNLAGLTTGALLSGAYHPSRDQVLYMDAGALLGTLTGGLVGAIVAATTNSDQAGTAVAFAGLIGGAALAVSLNGFEGGKTVGREDGAGGGAAMMLPLLVGAF